MRHLGVWLALKASAGVAGSYSAMAVAEMATEEAAESYTENNGVMAGL